MQSVSLSRHSLAPLSGEIPVLLSFGVRTSRQASQDFIKLLGFDQDLGQVRGIVGFYTRIS